VTRIFLTLASLGNIVLWVALGMGLSIGDARQADPVVQHAVGVHFLAGVGALVFAVMVHALVLTYFMGTGRWLEETCTAYRLPGTYQQRNRDLKWRTLPVMILSLTLLILTGAFGGAADPASAVGFQGWLGMSAAEIHMTMALLTLVVNFGVNVWEYLSLHQNATIIAEVVRDVRRIRTERGLES